MIGVVTVRWLREHDACRDKIQIIRRQWGEAVPITPDNLRLAATLGLSINWWAVRWLSPPSLLEEYMRQRAPALAEYDHQRTVLLGEYDRQRISLPPDFAHRRALLRVEYERQVASLRAESERQLAEIVIRLLEAQSEK